LDSPDASTTKPKTAAATTTAAATKTNPSTAIQGSESSSSSDTSQQRISSKENRYNHRAPPSLPKPASMTGKHTRNTCFKPGSGSNKNNRGVVRNPYFTGKPQQQQQQHNQQQQQQQHHPDQTTGPPQAMHANQENANTSEATSQLPKHSFFDKAATKKKAASQSKKRRKSEQLVHRFGFSPGPVLHDSQKALTYISPKHPDFPTRQYQLEITEAALNYNTLVSLPTGLGKTHIAAVVMYNYYRWFCSSTSNSSGVGSADSGGKIIFLAPTLPLVHQQIEACYKITGIPGHETAVLTGRLKAAERKELWKTKRVFYCTPQTVQKDLLGACGSWNPNETSNNNNSNDANGNASSENPETDPETALAFSRVVCLVLDEAHKATGDYAYTKVVDLLEKAAGAKFRIVGLSATPGTSIRAIQGVIEALRSCKIEARTDSDPSVAPYLHQKRTEIVVCPRNTSQRAVGKKLSGILHPLMERLREEGGLQVYGNDTLTSYSILKARQLYETRMRTSGQRAHGGLISCFHATHTLVQIRSDCHQGLGVVKTKLLRMKNTPQRGILSTIVKSDEFSEMVQMVLDATDGSGCENVVDPKLAKLCELLKHHFERNNACNHSSRAIVFAQFRDSVKEVVNCLESNLKPLVRSRYFVGQSKVSGGGNLSSNPENVHGMKQAEQQRAIKDFRNNVFNVLVCTSIGEEGLDIGEVDLIVNYDVISSPIRTIQRAGRTGRKRDGRVVSLIAEGPEEKTYKKRLAGEKTLLNALKNPKKFVMASHHPMLPNEPEREYKVLEFMKKLSLSEVAGAQHTPGVSKRAEAEKKKLMWRLDATEEYERQNLCGETMLFLDEDVAWKRLKGFFCKNRVDPMKLQGSQKANRLFLSLDKDQKQRILRKRNKIRHKRLGNGRQGIIEGILEAIEEFGPVHSEGTTRSGYKDILSIFPVEPIEKNHKPTATTAPNSTRVNKILWGNDVTSNNNKHLASAAASTEALIASVTSPDIDSMKIAATASRPIAERGKTPKELMPSVIANHSRSANTTMDDIPLSNGDSESRGKAQMGGVEFKGRPQARDLSVSNSLSSVLPKQPVPERSVFRLPTPPPSSDEESSLASAIEEKVAFRLPTPPPSPTCSASPEKAGKVAFRLPTPPPSPDSSASPEKGEKCVFRLPTPQSSSDSSSDEDEGEGITDSEMVPKQEKDLGARAHLHGAPLESNKDKVVFCLPTPQSSSSSSSSEGEDDDDGDTIVLPEPKVIRRISSENHTMDNPDVCEIEPWKGDGKGFPVSDKFPPSNQHSDSAVINLENSKFKPMKTKDTIDELSTPSGSTPAGKLSIGFDDENDLALSSLKSKSTTRSNNTNSDKLEGSNYESEEDVPLISFSTKNKDKPNSSKKKLVNDLPLIALRDTKHKKPNPSQEGNGVDKRVLPRVSFGNSPWIETKMKTIPKHTDGGNESEEDIPLISFSNKKKSKPMSSQKLTNAIPLIALRNTKEMGRQSIQDSNSAGKQVLPVDKSGENAIIQTRQRSQMSNKSRKKEINELGRKEDDELLISFKMREEGNGYNDTLEEGEQKNRADRHGCPLVLETPGSNSTRLHKDSALASTQIGILKRDTNCIKRPRIMETPDSASVPLSSESISTQNQSQNEIIDHSKHGKTHAKRPRILETPDSASGRSHVDLTSTSTQEPSQNEIVDHSKKAKNYKRLRIRSEDSDKEQNGGKSGHSFDVEETQQSYPNSTPTASVYKSASSVLNDTPQTSARTGPSTGGKGSGSDFLTDTPNTTEFDNGVEDIVCEVCASGDSTHADLLVLCDACNKGFHKGCYPINVDIEMDEPWYCDSCIHSTQKGQTMAPATVITCTYCCQGEGALRNDGKIWYHPLCAAFASKITATSCGSCSLMGAVQCNHNGCSSAIHPYCALDANWTIVRSSASTDKSSEYSIFCPVHKDKACQLPSTKVRIIRKESSTHERNQNSNASPRPKKLHKKRDKASGRPSDPTDRNLKAFAVGDSVLLPDSDEEESLESRRERLRKRRRQGLAKFVLDEAEIGSDQDRGDAEEEEEIRRIENEEEGYSQDSFINDNHVLTQHFSQDLLGEIDPDASFIGSVGRPIETPGGNHSINHNSHRVFDALRDRENQLKTPNFNRRMMRPTQDSPSSTPSSAKGLGNMNFIRSVLEHHRNGGDCDQIEAEYQRLEASSTAASETNTLWEATRTTTSTNPNRSNGCIDLTTPPEDGGGSSRTRDTNNRMIGNAYTNVASNFRRRNSSLAQPQQPSSQSGGLTAEQKARMEANRQKALQRRAELLAKKQHNRETTR
jgi:Fanconi anemia group M protein